MFIHRLWNSALNGLRAPSVQAALSATCSCRNHRADAPTAIPDERHQFFNT